MKHLEMNVSNSIIEFYNSREVSPVIRKGLHKATQMGHLLA